MMERLTTLTAVAVMLVACQEPPSTQEPSPAALVDEINRELAESARRATRANWIYESYITDDTAAQASQATEAYLSVQGQFIERAKAYPPGSVDPGSARALTLLKLDTGMPAPAAPAKRRELTELATQMLGEYGAGNYCREQGECLSLGELEEIVATSRDPASLAEAWSGWRTVSPPMRASYERFVTLANEGARELGFDDLGEMWQSGYDASPPAFRAEADRLWADVAPLYGDLHCYVRRQLTEYYGHDEVVPGEPIPAHLLGNMWAQEWGEIYDLVEPYADAGNFDVNEALERQAYTPRRMTESAERFFTSLNFPDLPETFWQRSLLNKPSDRDMLCHASAWVVDTTDDVRIRMCMQPTHGDLTTIYHELGHIYYYLAYQNQPYLYRAGAHDGFQEAVGDTITLSMTPAFLDDLGLMEIATFSDDVLINMQMRQALDKIAFLPFGRLIDLWRWDVFAGNIAPEDYNRAWWAMRTQYQGIAAPTPRNEAHFDPGAKYHIPANVPYTRYFLSYILQFQFHRALCDAAGFEGPLHECSIYGSDAAGDKLWGMLSRGASQPWQDTLQELTGARDMDASAIIEYFEPLSDWLRDENQDQTCGW